VTLILKILAVGLLHATFFTAYPETGPYGNWYLGVSVLVWSVFILFLNTSTKLIRFVSGAAGFAINLAAFALMAAAVAFTMPQRDGGRVLEKIQKGKYPDRDTVNAGLLRFGVKLDSEVKRGVKGLDAEVGKALKKLKEDR